MFYEQYVHAEHARNANMRYADAEHAHCAEFTKQHMSGLSRKILPWSRQAWKVYKKPLPLTIYICQRQLVQDCEAQKTNKIFLKTPKQNVVI
jgi:hypothetical protein